MKNYLKLLANCWENGERKENRTGVDTFAVTPQFFSHDMRYGFPLVTTKKMGLKSIGAELEFFIGGLTDKKWLQDRNCHVWDEWANPEAVYKKIADYEYAEKMLHEPSYKPLEGEALEKFRKFYQIETMDLGPVYGYQWRNYNKPYTGIISEKVPPNPDNVGDKLARVMQTLKTNPNDRRMVVNAWNELQVPQMALPPCHYCFTLQHINGKLSLNWNQRSCDAFLGIPYNIASYGLLLELIANEVGMEAHMLTGNLIDFHIYENHLDQVELQLSRTPRAHPTLNLPKGISIFDWTYDQFELKHYNPYPRIKGEVAV